MSRMNIITGTEYGQSHQEDHNDINRNTLEPKAERALLIQRTLLAEQQWYQNLQIAEIFVKLENILRAISKRMNLSAKVDSSTKLEAENPMTERLSLKQRTGAEVFKCSVVLLGESVIQTEVTMKYPKMPNGFYRGAAQPDAQWKLQQMQNADNYYVQALRIIIQELKWIRQISSDDIGKISSTIISTIVKVTNLLEQARSTLCMPEKRKLLDLCNLAITRCFSPPLPSDLVFSYYVNADRLVCAAYQVISKTNGAQSLTVTLADCLLPQLVDVLFLTDRALNVAQQFNYNIYPTIVEMSIIIKLKEARATLLYVENILYCQANRTKPSPAVIREKVLPLLYRLMEFPISIMLFTKQNKDQLTIIINLLETGLKFYRCTKIQDISLDTLDSFHIGRRETIERTIVKDKSELPTMNDIVGQIEAKKALMEAVVDPVLYPEWFAASGHYPWRCVLLYGPPGTGKTRLSQSVAQEMNTRFYQVSSSDLISTWIGQSEKLIRELFDHALAHNGASVIFIDEIDSLCRMRQITEDDNIRRVKTELFLQLQRLQSSLSSVLLICATNCPWELDAAFLRRFEKRIFVGLPDAASRGILLKKFMSKLTISSNINWNVLETVTDGFSGDDLRRFAREVAFSHLNKFKELYNLNCAISRSRLAAQIPVTMEDFEQTLQKFCPTVDRFELSKYMEYSKQI